MAENNKIILEKPNAAIAEGDNEGFLSFCTDNMECTFVGDKTLQNQAKISAYGGQDKFVGYVR